MPTVITRETKVVLDGLLPAGVQKYSKSRDNWDQFDNN